MLGNGACALALVAGLGEVPQRVAPTSYLAGKALIGTGKAKRTPIVDTCVSNGGLRSRRDYLPCNVVAYDTHDIVCADAGNEGHCECL